MHLELCIFCFALLDIDQLITISGMVIRTSNIMPEMKQGYFKCTVCEHGAQAGIDRGRIIEPVLCPNCNTNHSFTLVHNRSTFTDKQIIRLQEDLGNYFLGCHVRSYANS